MAIGALADVFPIAVGMSSAITAAFASEVRGSIYLVSLVTHTAHKSLQSNLAKKFVPYSPVSMPTVLASMEVERGPSLEPQAPSFSQKTKLVDNAHKQECLSLVETIFHHGEVSGGDFIVNNFFALEVWSLVELFQAPCVVSAPYVVPYSAPSSFELHFKKMFPLLYDYFCGAAYGKVSWKDIVHWM